jgi:RHS repeat-associated protein
VRTEETAPWVQASRYDAFGTPEEEPELRAAAEPMLPRFGYRGELALGPMVYLRARVYDTRSGRFTTPDPLAAQPSQAAAVSPYIYASSDPLNHTDPLGMFSLGSVFSDVSHVVKSTVNGVKHVVHGVTGAVTRGADALAGTIAHAYHDVHAVLSHVAEIARKDAVRIIHVVRDAATRVVTTVRDAVSRSAGTSPGSSSPRSQDWTRLPPSWRAPPSSRLSARSPPRASPRRPETRTSPTATCSATP